MSLFAMDLTREPCAVEDCKERPRYTGEFGERLCGPHFRDQRREADELAAVRAPIDVAPAPSPAPPEVVPEAPTLTTQEILMPEKPTLVLCQWPGCDRPVLRTRWCARDIQRVRILGEKPSTAKDVAELARAWDARQADHNRHPSPAAAAPVPTPVVVDSGRGGPCNVHIATTAGCDACSERGVWAGIEAPTVHRTLTEPEAVAVDEGAWPIDVCERGVAELVHIDTPLDSVGPFQAVDTVAMCTLHGAARPVAKCVKCKQLSEIFRSSLRRAGVTLTGTCIQHGPPLARAECDVCVLNALGEVSREKATHTHDSTSSSLRDEPLAQIAILIGGGADALPGDASDDEIVAAVERHVRLTRELHTRLETAQNGMEDATFLRQALQLAGTNTSAAAEAFQQLNSADAWMLTELFGRISNLQQPRTVEEIIQQRQPLTGEELTQRWFAWQEALRLEAQRNNLLDRIAHEYTQLTCGFSPGDAFVDVLDTRIAMLRRVALGGA